MIESLLQELNNRDLENDNILSLIEMKEENDVLSLTFTLQNDFDQEDFQIWEVECKNFVQRRICDDAFNSFDVFEKHVLLWEYIQPSGSLYFKGTTDNVAGLLGELYLKHMSITEDWISFREYLNHMVEIKELVARGYGLLAKGPLRIIEEYSEVIKRFKIETSIISDGIIRFWDGYNWIERLAPYYVLVFGRSFVIAEDFKEKRIQ